MTMSDKALSLSESLRHPSNMQKMVKIILGNKAEEEISKIPFQTMQFRGFSNCHMILRRA